MIRSWTAAAAAALLLTTACTMGTSDEPAKGGSAAAAEGESALPDNVQPIEAEKLVLDAFKGKKVAYAALGSGYPLEDQWRNVFAEAFPQLGMEYKENVADIDPQRLAQNAQSLLNEDPDVLIVHAGDTTNLNNLIKQAHQQGIYVFNINLMTSESVDGYVGGNFNVAEYELAKDMGEDCTERGKKKVAIMTGFPGDGLSQVAGAAYERAFEETGMEVVANQPQNYDATKAKDMAVTVMQQHPDLCGFIGTWDNMMIGAGNAVDQAGKQGEVVVYTSDASATACKALAEGTMTGALDYGVGIMAEQVVALVQFFLQTQPPAGSQRAAIFPRFRMLDKDAAATPGAACYTGKPV